MRNKERALESVKGFVVLGKAWWSVCSGEVVMVVAMAGYVVDMAVCETRLDILKFVVCGLIVRIILRGLL